MRLIDADEFKKEIDTWGCNDYDKYDFLEAIDEAPTVEPDNDVFEWCTDCKEYDQEKHCCHRWSSKIREAVEEIKQYRLDELRPHGEWKHVAGEDNDVECPFCGFQEDGIYYNFCPQCGADMRGENKFNDLVVFDDQPKRQLENPDCHNEL